MSSSDVSILVHVNSGLAPLGSVTAMLWAAMLLQTVVSLQTSEPATGWYLVDNTPLKSSKTTSVMMTEDCNC